MAKHVKGSAIANASSYKLYLANGTELATQYTNVSEGIDFDLSTIAALSAAGTYSLGVKAISGDTTKFLDSVMSNIVSYVVEETPVTPTTYTLTINVTPSDAKLMVYNGSTSTDPVLHEGTGSTVLSNIEPNKTLRLTASKAGYNAIVQTVTVKENTTLNLELEAISVPEGTINIISQGTLHEKKSLSSSAYKMTDNDAYFVYDQIPVEAGATYQVSSGLRAWWLKSDKTKISTINFASSNYTATAPANAAYISVTYPYSAVTPETAWFVKTP
jgi:hypothetical protein